MFDGHKNAQEIDLDHFAEETGNNWYIDDAIGESNENN